MSNETIFVKTVDLQNVKTYKSMNENYLTLCDPITQICKRIEAFFKGDRDITCRYMVNNQKSLGPKIDPDTGEQMTRQMIIDGEERTVLLEEDHLSEFRIFVADVEKAQCLSNVIRHQHVFNEIYEGAYDDSELHLRAHYLLVHVFTLNAVDPDGPQGGTNPWITDDDTSSGLTEVFGLEPINWDDITDGCEERLAPSDTSTSDIPKGAPDEYEQQQWENTINTCNWKWKWLKTALNGNKNIMSTSHEFNDGMNIWRFIECNYLPVVFMEDNLSTLTGMTSVLPEDLIPLVFAVFGKFQIGTYARKAS